MSIVTVMVALSTSLVLLNPMVEQLDDVVDTGVTRRTEVILMVGSGIDEDALLMEGVEVVGVSTKHDLNTIGVEGDLEDYRTLDLDGTVPEEEIVDEVRVLEGAGDVYIRLGRRVAPTLDRVLEMLPLATPAAILVWGAALLLCVAGVLRKAGRPSLVAIWVRWSMVVLVPMVATVFLISGVASVVWPPIASPVVSSLATGDISGREVLIYGFDWGLRALAVAWIVVTVLAMASPFTRQGRHI